MAKTRYELSDKGWDLYGKLTDRIGELLDSMEERWGTTISPKVPVSEVDRSHPDITDYWNAKNRLDVLREVDGTHQAPWEYGATKTHPHSEKFQAMFDKGYIVQVTILDPSKIYHSPEPTFSSPEHKEAYLNLLRTEEEFVSPLDDEYSITL